MPFFGRVGKVGGCLPGLCINFYTGWQRTHGHHGNLLADEVTDGNILHPGMICSFFLGPPKFTPEDRAHGIMQ
jgi:hypothetical protein